MARSLVDLMGVVKVEAVTVRAVVTLVVDMEEAVGLGKEEDLALPLRVGAAAGKAG